jgi:hypothetical protein
LLLERPGFLVALGTPGGVGWGADSLGRIFLQLVPLMNFPCNFPVKVMGANQDDFERLVIEIIQKHASISPDEVVTTRLSRNGKFLSVTVHVNAKDQDQLDAIYRELSAHERVLMML